MRKYSEQKWRLCSASIFPWERFREQCHNSMSILLICGWQNGKCHFISEISYFFRLLLVIPACRHTGYGDDAFKFVFRVLVLFPSDKIMLVYLDNLGSSIFQQTSWQFPSAMENLILKSRSQITFILQVQTNMQKYLCRYFHGEDNLTLPIFYHFNNLSGTCLRPSAYIRLVQITCNRKVPFV